MSAQAPDAAPPAEPEILAPDRAIDLVEFGQEFALTSDGVVIALFDRPNLRRLAEIASIRLGDAFFRTARAPR